MEGNWRQARKNICSFNHHICCRQCSPWLSPRKCHRTLYKIGIEIYNKQLKHHVDQWYKALSSHYKISRKCANMTKVLPAHLIDSLAFWYVSLMNPDMGQSVGHVIRSLLSGKLASKKPWKTLPTYLVQGEWLNFCDCNIEAYPWHLRTN